MAGQIVEISEQDGARVGTIVFEDGDDREFLDLIRGLDQATKARLIVELRADVLQNAIEKSGPPYEALRETTQALWDIQGTLNLLRQTEVLDLKGFPLPVASTIRMIHARVDDAIQKAERVL